MWAFLGDLFQSVEEHIKVAKGLLDDVVPTTDIARRVLRILGLLHIHVIWHSLID
jgi:hypothetical protein